MNEIYVMFKMYLDAYEKKVAEYKDIDALYHDGASIEYEDVHRAEVACSINAEIFAEFVSIHKDAILDALHH